MLAELLGGLGECTVVILSGIGVIIGVATVVKISVIQSSKHRIMIDHIRIRHISEVTEVVAPEHLPRKASDDIPSIIVVIDVIDNACRIL